MHDDPKPPHRTPKASGSFAPSGTHALRVTIVPERLPTEGGPGEQPLPPEMTADALVAVEPEAAGPLAGDADHAAEPAIAYEDHVPVVEAQAAPQFEPVIEAEPLAPEAVSEVVARQQAEPISFAPPASVYAAADEHAAAPVEAELVTLDLDVPPMMNGSDSHAVAKAYSEPTSPHTDAVERAQDAQRPTSREMRQAVIDAMAAGNDVMKPERSLALFEQMSLNLGTILEDAREGATLYGQKLMEFAQANFDSSIELARNYAHARTMPEVVNGQAAFLQRQLALLNRQAEEIRTLAGEIASKKAERLQTRIKA